jgi:hypothetical protein
MAGPNRVKQMIEISKQRDGTLTEVTAICPSNDVATAARALFDNYGRITKQDGLVLRTSCKRASAETLIAELARLSYRTAPAKQAAVAQTAAPGWNGAKRELILATMGSEAAARRVPGFTGFGEEFVGSEIHGHLWGERVRYAYYA